MSESIAKIRAAVRHAIARHLPHVLLRESVQESNGRFVAMFRASLTAVLAEVGPVPAAVHRRLEHVAGALLLAGLRDCGMCQEQEFMCLQEAIEMLHTGMLRNQFAWWLRHCAECAFLHHRAFRTGETGSVALGELETAFIPHVGETDRRSELQEARKRGLKIARMCRELRIARAGFYKRFLAWPDDSPQVQRIRDYCNRGHFL